MTDEQVAQNKTDIALLTQTMRTTNEKIDRNHATTCEKIDKLCDQVGGYAEKSDSSFEGIDHALRGKDSENPGLFTRMDRQENFAKRVKAVITMILGTIITSIVGLVGNFLGMFGKGH